MKAPFVQSLVSLVALVALASCGESTATGPAPSTIAAPKLTVIAMPRSYPTLGTLVSYSVLGAFEDQVSFSIPAADSYTVTIAPSNYNVACSGRACTSPGSVRTTISSSVITTDAGVPVASIAGTGVVALAPGNYVLVIDGVGAGTKKYLNVGGYALMIKAPVVVLPPSCDYVRDILQTQGYTNVQIEAMVAAMQAASPPKCTGD